ncbi:UDP-N-acetylglucosamine--N-acetylmuramyl-(pentapeptide) pyrophosphoryl-undecaprenol N-acetylglucosamine transferase [Georgenia sp. MJ206]|uniref:UDP-N-acetylglucosamine--N-acetylmuramyl- (pentapeptide) pyrophosphoryl-undecaprenol N-acetylglucosamine transferase n=1 Tax=Georgenia wangjunii TaxID=3117730 RepID=UPI002F2614EC
MAEPAPLRVLLAGGGSAGHVNPLLATATDLAARPGGATITVLGTEAGLEARLVPAAGLPLRIVPRVPLPRRPSPDLLRLPARLTAAVRAARAAITESGAEVVVGFGGYVSTPAYLAARAAGVPVVVHEQNARPGLANRRGARWARAVAVTFPSTPLPGGQRTGMPLRTGIANRPGARWARAVAVTFPGTPLPGGQLTGMPLRAGIAALLAERATPELAAARRRAGAAALGLDPARTTLLVTGGSLGAQRVNEAASACAGDLVGAGVQVLHLTGAGKDAAVADAVAAAGAGEHYHVRPYLDAMEHAYACADLVLARSGAGTVSELAALGIAAVYVPLPIGNGEQRLNATGVVDAGGGLLVEDADLTAALVRSHVVPLLADRARLTAMGEAAAAAGVRDGAARLGDLVLAAAGRGAA